MSEAISATSQADPTVVLVPGAFTGKSRWAGLIEELDAAGVAVISPANPPGGMADATAYIASVAREIPGPVLLVGHACDGVEITNAALQADNVVGLAYVADLISDDAASTAKGPPTSPRIAWLFGFAASTWLGQQRDPSRCGVPATRRHGAERDHQQRASSTPQPRGAEAA